MGCGLFALGLLSPTLLNVHSFGVMRALSAGVLSENHGHLVDAGVRLVLLNTLRALPAYLGAFLVVEGLFPKRKFLTDLLIPTAMVVAFYYLIQFVWGIKYDFRMPALIQIIGISTILRVNVTGGGVLNKVIVLTQLLFGLQWLDIVPSLTRYGFGHGEISLAIKAASVLTDGVQALNLLGLVICAVQVANALLTGKFMVDYYRHIRLVEADRERRLEVERMRAEAVRARNLLESQALVHDLKTPLTTITGLASVLKELAADAESRAYLRKIIEYSMRMNTMISQVLSGDAREVLRGEELLERLKVQLPSEKTGERVRFTAQGELPSVRVNGARVVRALANLVHNSVWAVNESQAPEAGRVDVVFEPGRERDALIITVRDNGIGIPQEKLDRIWDPGFSTRGSSGLGLTFAREVVQENGGAIILESHEGAGTVCRIEFPAHSDPDREEKPQ